MRVLTPPFLVSALVLIAAGVAKLRAPDGARLAMRTLRMRVPAFAIRLFAAVELALGVSAVLDPSRPVIRGAVAGLYAVFALISLLLARRRASCGCFGERDVPASMIGSLLSAVLAAVAVMTLVWAPHGLGWVLAQAPDIAGGTVLGILGAAYATVVAYTDLPLAWEAWSGR